MRRKNITSEMMKSYIAESLLLLMSKKSYHKITICEIIEKAGVNRSTYYRNFKSKEDIIGFWFKDLTEEYFNHVNSDIELYKYLCDIFHIFFMHKEQLLLIYKQGISYILLNTLIELFSKKVLKEDERNFSEQFKVYFRVGSIYSSLLLWMSNDMNPPPEEFASITINEQKNISLKALMI